MRVYPGGVHQLVSTGSITRIFKVLRLNKAQSDLCGTLFSPCFFTYFYFERSPTRDAVVFGKDEFHALRPRLDRNLIRIAHIVTVFLTKKQHKITIQSTELSLQLSSVAVYYSEGEENSHGAAAPPLKPHRPFRKRAAEKAA